MDIYTGWLILNNRFLFRQRCWFFNKKILNIHTYIYVCIPIFLLEISKLTPVTSISDLSRKITNDYFECPVMKIFSYLPVTSHFLEKRLARVVWITRYIQGKQYKAWQIFIFKNIVSRENCFKQKLQYLKENINCYRNVYRSWFLKSF